MTETPTETPTSTPTPTPDPTETPTPTPTPTPTATTAPHVPPLVFPGTLHGEFTVPGKDGCGFTVFSQTGEAIALAEDSITVKSQDGFEKAYTIDDSTWTLAGRRDNEVRQGDWVSVTATTVGETATAAYVFDLSKPRKSFWRGWWFSKQWRPGAKWRTPTPCPTPPTPTPTVPPTTPPAPTPTDMPTTPTPPPTPTDAPTTPTTPPTSPPPTTPVPTPTGTTTPTPSPTPTS
ncbi:hypothetical protein [Streptosporangium sp. NPDC000396]|uniref:hypothetical protein n=1 Tax=Streptosporangium sp. NPDC000396 TaxID=3366185 RepID=UPI0036ABDD00